MKYMLCRKTKEIDAGEGFVIRRNQYRESCTERKTNVVTYCVIHVLFFVIALAMYLTFGLQTLT